MGDHLPWRMDGYVVCPACGDEDDGAAMFGDADRASRDVCDWGLFDGLIGECQRCGASIRLRLEIAPAEGANARPGATGSADPGRATTGGDR